MKFDDISITRALVVNNGGRFHIKVEVAGCKFDGFFDDLGGFLHAVSDLATFVAVRTGKAKADEASRFASRSFAPGTTVN